MMVFLWRIAYNFNWTMFLTPFIKSHSDTTQASLTTLDTSQLDDETVSSFCHALVPSLRFTMLKLTLHK
jgi:hypothetical protein